jgi:hypothetical protein
MPREHRARAADGAELMDMDEAQAKEEAVMRYFSDQKYQ